MQELLTVGNRVESPYSAPRTYTVTETHPTASARTSWYIILEIHPISDWPGTNTLPPDPQRLVFLLPQASVTTPVPQLLRDFLPWLRTFGGNLRHLTAELFRERLS